MNEENCIKFYDERGNCVAMVEIRTETRLGSEQRDLDYYEKKLNEFPEIEI